MKKITRWLRALLAMRVGCAAGLALLAYGCLQFKPQPIPERKSFLLEAVRPADAVARPAPTPAAPTLKVRLFRATPGLEGRGFVVYLPDNRAEQQFQNQFFVPPAALVSNVTRLWLKDAAIFRSVVDAGSPEVADYSLEGVLDHAGLDLRDHKHPKAVLALAFTLVNEQSPLFASRFDHAYREEIPLANTHPESVARGLSQALARILTRLESDLRQELTPPPAA